MSSLSEADSDLTTTALYSEHIEAFVASFEFARLLPNSAQKRPLWLCVATDDPDRVVFERLHQETHQCVVVSPLATMTVEARTALLTAITHYPQRYVSLLQETLRPHSEQLAGLLVSRDLSPWVRHLVYACKALAIRTVLLPNVAIKPPWRFDPRKIETRILRLSREFWTVPSSYSEPDVLPDTPVTDYVIAISVKERAGVVAAGYPDARVLRLHPKKSLTRLHRSPGLLGRSLFDKLHHLRTKTTVRWLAERLRSLAAKPTKPFDPSQLDKLFSGLVEPQLRAGLVAYHRAIDASTAYVPAMLGYRRLQVVHNIEEAQAADVFACWGGIQGEHRKRRIKRWAKRLNRPLLLIEDGLFRSVEIGLTGTPTVSVLLDDRSAYYDATRSSRLEKLLASKHQFSPQDWERANRCMRLIVEHRISKYNHAPDNPLPFARDSVLVVDQRKGDLSVTTGLANEASFREMLLFACRENPGCSVLIKRHPDALSGGKQSYFSDETLAQLGPLPNVHLIDYETNPHALFDCCKKVYVVSSGMGFEALIRGIPVHCFGMPFYAGWGLTIDQLTVARRKRTRKFEDLFFAVCILHSRYYDPIKQRPCSLEEVIQYLATARDKKQAKKPNIRSSTALDKT